MFVNPFQGRCPCHPPRLAPTTRLPASAGNFLLRSIMTQMACKLHASPVPSPTHRLLDGTGSLVMGVAQFLNPNPVLRELFSLLFLVLFVVINVWRPGGVVDVRRDPPMRLQPAARAPGPESAPPACSRSFGSGGQAVGGLRRS